MVCYPLLVVGYWLRHGMLEEWKDGMLGFSVIWAQTKIHYSIIPVFRDAVAASIHARFNKGNPISFLCSR
jgi:hypothetical protein